MLTRIFKTEEVSALPMSWAPSRFWTFERLISRHYFITYLCYKSLLFLIVENIVVLFLHRCALQYCAVRQGDRFGDFHPGVLHLSVVNPLCVVRKGSERIECVTAHLLAESGDVR